jgi:hypothetical protein
VLLSCIPLVEALRLWKRITERYPDVLLFLEQLAKLLMENEQVTDAIELLTRWVERYPFDVQRGYVENRILELKSHQPYQYGCGPDVCHINDLESAGAC